MKRMKRLVLLVMMTVTGFFLSGCAAGPALQLLGGAAITGTYFAGQMKKADIKDTVEGDFDQVWEAVLTATEEMEIKVLEKKLDDQKREGVIIAETSKYKNIKIVIASITPSMTNVGVTVRKSKMSLGFTGGIDYQFSIAIVNNIKKKTSFQATRRPGKKKRFLVLIAIKRSNVRAAGNVKAKIVFVAPKGTKLQRIGKSGNWYKITLPSGKTGYIYKTLVKPAPTKARKKGKSI